jgi:hypothetical protein
MLLENNLETSSCQSADFCKERFIFHIPFYLKHFLWTNKIQLLDLEKYRYLHILMTVYIRNRSTKKEILSSFSTNFIANFLNFSWYVL